MGVENEVDAQAKHEVIDRIDMLREEKNALIIAHNYQRPEVQDIADVTGDSLELARIASDTEADVIVVCGVSFMAESAAILCPDKKVLLPEKDAGCSLADTIDAPALRKFKEKHPDIPVVAYVNTSAEVKALSDVCCTSANAVEVVSALDAQEVLLIPDKNLAHWTDLHTSAHVIPWEGYCPSHNFLSEEDILLAMKKHPNAKVVVHPECKPGVCELADHVTSTSGMSRYVRQSDASEFIIGTEIGMLHRLRKDNPEKRFYTASTYMVCPNMKRITLESIANSLEHLEHVVKLDESVMAGAKKALDYMLDIT